MSQGNHPQGRPGSQHATASAAEALRRAQRKIRDRYTDEYYWAGFTFHGAWW
ncbi:MAG: hypothetical protein SX243_02830 [Acidobacteriota bacterium]|nr:hypothetical protein [Acidobacteriota bacterium]